jgi:hypothetical protein
MKILFVDIDGVLNTDGFRNFFGPSKVDPFLVENLASIVFITGCKIVISSSWRFNMSEVFDAIQCDAFRNKPSQKMIDAVINAIIGSTFDFGSRKDEILKWVEFPPEGITVDCWVAVDDLELDLPDANFVLTSDESGLQMDKVREVIRKLNID